ncbi:MAG: hypothetical protein LBR23_00800 [Spirochaetaceae bacterium]|nr:hypothetical protein [Spirochaetaceae bacterium]
MRRRFYLVVFLFCSIGFTLSSQSHISVPLGRTIYFLLENAQARGLCKPLPGAKPYSRAVILRAIDEILESQGGKAPLSDDERQTFQKERAMYALPQKTGVDWGRGGFYTETTGKIRFSLDITASWESLISEAIEGQDGDFDWGTDNWGTVKFQGDMGEDFSYSLQGGGGMMRAPRKQLGPYDTYYKDYIDSGAAVNQEITSYSQPLAFFPYTYRKNWDGSIFVLSNLSSSGFYTWPEGLSFGYNILGEMSGALLAGHITYRVGRISREWAGMSNGQSLALNAAARPFLAAEATFSPFDWLSFSALTGILEYYNTKGIKESAMTFQNAFSQEIIEFNYKEYVHFDIGSIAVWPKRFELGYAYPLNSSFFYQNNIGDFDNLAIAMNLRGTLPGRGFAWFSFFADEFDLSTGGEFFKLDRNMYAFQVGAAFLVPVLSFSTLSFSLTKIEPYCYTHNRVFVPWYGTDESGNPLPMETGYYNNGENLGYYLPPNSLELLAGFETMSGANTKLRAQVQLVIHGADYGSNAVDGSSPYSELDPDKRGGDVGNELYKFFLQDGAYQWQTVFKVGAEHRLARYRLPIMIFGEIGLYHSFFTNIDGPANSGDTSKFDVVNSAEYPQTTRFIATVGFRVYPDF